MSSLRLDCESRASTFDSLRQLFPCGSEELQAFITDPTLDADFERDFEVLPPKVEYVYERACIALGAPAVPEELCWFHGTRVPPGTTFVEGILPLPRALEQLKGRILGTLTLEADRLEVLDAFDRDQGLTFQLQHKLTSATACGPFAMFVLETALDAHATGQHSYVDMPEIIDDLCAEVQAACGRDLLPIFERAWRPAVVKFVTPTFSAKHHVAVALSYARSCALRGAPERSAIANFDGNNSPVPASSILSIRYL